MVLLHGMTVIQLFSLKHLKYHATDTRLFLRIEFQYSGGPVVSFLVTRYHMHIGFVFSSTFS